MHSLAIAGLGKMGGNMALRLVAQGHKPVVWNRDPAKSAVYTGLAYVFTVLFLIFPYFVLGGYLAALVWTLLNAIIVIVVFTYYVSVAQEVPFRRRFAEMAGISLGVAALSFLIGYLVRTVLGIEV